MDYEDKLFYDKFLAQISKENAVRLIEQFNYSSTTVSRWDRDFVDYVVNCTTMKKTVSFGIQDHLYVFLQEEIHLLNQDIVSAAENISEDLSSDSEYMVSPIIVHLEGKTKFGETAFIYEYIDNNGEMYSGECFSKSW